MVVKILDSAYRPPQFLMGAHGSAWVVEGDCAPSYLEVWLAPLGAYTLLGLPMDQLSGQLVDLVDVLGAAGRRLAEQLRETPSWRRRFALMDQFLLRRLEHGPRPSPEVGRAWERLVATGGAAPRNFLCCLRLVHAQRRRVRRRRSGLTGQPEESRFVLRNMSA